ncbi:rhodanese-like domain-containing protein [uncultured Microbacterium sp.]|uniref:rhodanese-like domain-containing protein n=1 Tax=uncultured Microbacterium sp. TaxID=191216 RepID=UPI0025E51144|nr:rhodanese-like domain-containing protein [uncultured Microbacterium sp.]
MTSAQEHFSAKLAFETDASDVHAARRAGEEIVVVDVRSEAAWAQGRVVDAVHLPYRDIDVRAPREIPLTARVVVYCWSPGCNAADKGALAFARLGYDVRIMIGGFEYWAREGYPIENADGVHRRPVDPLVGVPRIRSRV